MGGFKRLCLLIFSLALIALFVFGALIVTDFYGVGEYMEHLAMSQDLSAPASIAVLVLLGIVAFGALVTLLYALFSPGKRKRLVDERVDGTIVISRKALENCVQATALSYPGVAVQDTRVHITNRGDHPKIRVDLEMSVDPARFGSVADKTAALQQDISSQLSHFVGYEIKRVDIQIHEMTPQLDQSELGNSSQGSTTIIMSPMPEGKEVVEVDNGR